MIVNILGSNTLRRHLRTKERPVASEHVLLGRIYFDLWPSYGLDVPDSPSRVARNSRQAVALAPRCYAIANDWPVP